MGPQNGGHFRQVFAVQRWSLAYIWLHLQNCWTICTDKFENAFFFIKCILLQTKQTCTTWMKKSACIRVNVDKRIFDLLGFLFQTVNVILNLLNIFGFCRDWIPNVFHFTVQLAYNDHSEDPKIMTVVESRNAPLCLYSRSLMWSLRAIIN